MTDTLTDLLHDQADQVDFAAPDLAGITRTGERRLRRRRTGALVGGLAALALVGSGVYTVTGPGDTDTAVDAADAGGATRPVAYALGSTIHLGDDSVDAGHQVRGLVRTTAGVVFFDEHGTVFQLDGGEARPLGHTSPDLTAARLVSDDDGPLVGWVDPTGDRPRFVVHDLDTGEGVTLPARTVPGMSLLDDTADAALFYALDDRTAYLRDATGVVTVDVDTGRVSRVDAPGRQVSVSDAEDGVMVLHDNRGAKVGATWQDATRITGSFADLGYLSPDARWVTFDADQPDVRDTRTGEAVTLDIDGRVFATGYEWLDDDTLAVLASRTEKGPIEILRCEVPSGACEVAVPDLGSFGEAEGAFTLPVGVALG